MYDCIIYIILYYILPYNACCIRQYNINIFTVLILCYKMLRVLLRKGLRALASIAWGRGKTMGVRDFNLRREKTEKKMGKIGLNQFLMHIHPFPPISPQIFLCAPLQIASQNKNLLKYKTYWRWGRCSQFALPSYPYG